MESDYSLTFLSVINNWIFFILNQINFHNHADLTSRLSEAKMGKPLIL